MLYQGKKEGHSKCIVYLGHCLFIYIYPTWASFVHRLDINIFFHPSIHQLSNNHVVYLIILLCKQICITVYNNVADKYTEIC